MTFFAQQKSWRQQPTCLCDSVADRIWTPYSPSGFSGSAKLIADAGGIGAVAPSSNGSVRAWAVPQAVAAPEFTVLVYATVSNTTAGRAFLAQGGSTGGGGGWQIQASHIEYRANGSSSSISLSGYQTVGKAQLFSLVVGQAGGNAYVDGVLAGSQSYAFQSAATQTYGAYVAGTDTLSGRGECPVHYVAYLPRRLSAAEIQFYASNPWQIFKPLRRALYFDVGGGGVTGTLSVTLENFTSGINGTTTIVGTIAQTMAAFTSAITGTSEVPGTIAATTEAAVGALEGTVGTGGPTGTIDGLGADFTASMTGTTTVVGASSAQMEDFLSSITGTTTVVGTMAITSDDMIMTANGFVGDAPSARFRTLVGMGE